MLYFAYGSNILRARLEERIGPLSDAPEAALARGYELRFHKRGVDGSGKADAVSGPSGELGGALYRVTSEHLSALDRFERGYRRREITVESREGPVQAWTYLALAEFLAADLRPFDWYIELMVAGARELGLPRDYVEKLAGLPVKVDTDKTRAAAARRLLPA